MPFPDPTPEDLATVRKVLTTVVRGERFCDGYIESMLDAGVVRAAVRRLKELAELS
jgi:hypothetical protein